MTSIDADQVWRQDNYTVNNTLFRVSESTRQPASLVEYEASALEAGDYKIFVSWLANVTAEARQPLELGPSGPVHLADRQAAYTA